MKILLVQESGQHLANIDYRECNCLARELVAMGHEAVCWGPGHDAYNTKFSDMYSWADVVFVCEQYDETGWVPTVRGDKLVIYWAIDAHCAFQHEEKLAKRVDADIILCAVLPMVGEWIDFGLSMWWPNAYPVDRIDAEGLTASKKHGLGFVGTAGPHARQGAIQDLQRAVGMKWANMVLGDDMVKELSSYRIGWNMNIGSDINYRTFETLGVGTMLLTNNTQGLDSLFDVGRDLVVYDNTADCISKTEYYLAHDHERCEIAERGHRIASMKHGYDTRAEQLIRVIETKGDYKPYAAHTRT